MTTTPADHRASVDEHHARVAALLAGLRSTATETVALDAALGRRLSDPVHSAVALPPFRNAQMDGIAVRATDLTGGRGLPVVGTIPAAPGAVAPLAPGTAVRIMTGAPVPEGADAVVPIERVVMTATDAGETAAVAAAMQAGAFIREAGGDLPAGGEVLAAGTVLASRHLAALAAAGHDRVRVARRIRIAVISTGAELAPPGATLAPGQIFDANGPALAAAARAAGCAVMLQERTNDDPDEFARVLAQAAASADIVVTAGGISQGAFEVVREVLEPHGAWVGSLALQPGGPQATARVAGVPVLCFPGNPVSAQLSFELFLAPALRELAGLPARTTESRRLTVDLDSVADRVQLVRARADDRGGITPVAGPGSHLVVAMAHADRVIVVPAEATHLPAGSEVTAWVL
ncbi:gephyrin-like molybdotransferase Glp [Microcella sp.]|uniref:molybdopterin molybdotransferase MoeA n=1 Tax=Microcella sp. TaxID=1913979 RepID=UPI0039188A3A